MDDLQEEKNKTYSELQQHTESQPNHYAGYLARENRHTSVSSTEDIYNSHGALLVRAGTRVDDEVADRILRHKLVKPLAEQVHIEQCVGWKDIEAQLQAVFNRFPDLRILHDALDFEKTFYRMLHSSKLQPLLAQRLTILRDQFPAIFENSVFCGWFSALIAREMGQDSAFCHAALLTGLLREIGFLHLDSDILGSTSELSADQWRSIQAHVIVGYLITSQEQDLDPLVPVGIIEHHERADGIGYPVGLYGSSLSLLGQVIGMADAIQALRFNVLDEMKLSIRYIEPFLKINRDTHLEEVSRTVFGIIRQAPLPRQEFNMSRSVDEFRQTIKQREEGLCQVCKQAGSLYEKLLESEACEKAVALRLTLDNLKSRICSSGLASTDSVDCITDVDTHDSNALHELDELWLLQTEVKWHLGYCCKAYRMYADDKERSQEPAQNELVEAGEKLCELYAAIDE